MEDNGGNFKKLFGCVSMIQTIRDQSCYVLPQERDDIMSWSGLNTA